jgi:hypothetical protein
MARKIEIKSKWEESGDGVNCVVSALDERTKRILSIVRVNVPVYTQFDFESQYGISPKEEVERSAIEIAQKIAERAPE